MVDATTNPSSRVRLENGANLYFETVLASDSGVYKFSGTNLDSTQQADVHVAVACEYHRHFPVAKMYSCSGDILLFRFECRPLH